MTRINVVPPAELMDQHLLAELRELPRMFTYIEKHMNGKTYSGPSEYTMGAGHMKFFSDKASFLYMRMSSLFHESVRRGINFKFDFDQWASRYMTLPLALSNDYTPTEDALRINRERIAERISERPGFYRYYGKKIE